MSDAGAGFLRGLAMAGVTLFLYMLFGGDRIAVNGLRTGSCATACVTLDNVHSSEPALCVCKNGKTYPGKSPEFYKVSK